MKRRNGLVSNSSSSSYVVNLRTIPAELRLKLLGLTNQTDNLSRCTGIIRDIEVWHEETWNYDGEESYRYDGYEQVCKLAVNPDIVIVRESDEEMGGSFTDYGFTAEDLKPFVLFDFEYH